MPQCQALYEGYFQWIILNSPWINLETCLFRPLTPTVVITSATMWLQTCSCCLLAFDEWACNISSPADLKGFTVSNKTIPITNPNTVHEAHCNHTWEFRLALVWPNKVQTLGYKPVPWVMWFGPEAVEIYSFQVIHVIGTVLLLSYGNVEFICCDGILCQHWVMWCLNSST